MKFKKGDNVIVIAGKHKGEKGSILRVLRDENRVVVEGIHKVKRQIKPKTRNEKGSMVEREAAFHASNVMIVDPKSGKGTRIGSKKVGEKNVRIAKKSGQELK